MKTIFNSEYPVVRMIHLEPLLGKEGFTTIDNLLDNAKKDIEALQLGGVDAIMLENNNDAPYSEYLELPGAISFGYIACELSKYISLPLGYTVLANDWLSALSLAKLTKASFIRLDTFVDKVEKVEGGMIIDPNPEEIMAFKKKIDVDVDIWTDVHVKHTEMLEEKSITESINQALDNGSNGIIISGSWTGKETNLDDLKEAKTATDRKVPVIVGSGINSDNIKLMSEHSDIGIVGSSIKRDGRIDMLKVKSLMSKVK
ncbi:MAG: BtpA/SgcQ family protein [Candidatus Dojkabacteria bacterium]|nr:BtpA/SgcQ family protein [Candidatus Dojkabacteria bacterium]MDQ7020667.1 BtpA/SgcQ family protein [Candidatus Dojkabacteria bacterium]